MHPRRNSTTARKRSPIRVLLDRIRKNVPAALLTLPIWLLWRTIDGRKVPYYCNGTPRHGALDSPEDRSQLTTFEVAEKALQTLQGFTGLGIALGKVPGCDVHISGIYLDHVIDGDFIDPRALEILAEADCYAELSPSGDGVHILGTGDVGQAAVKSDEVGLEISSRARYLTVTGRTLDLAWLGELASSAALARRLFSRLVAMNEDIDLGREAYALRMEGADGNEHGRDLIVLTNVVDSRGINLTRFSLGPILTAHCNLTCWICWKRIATGRRYLRHRIAHGAPTCLHCAGDLGRPLTDESLPS